jgi:UTP--glucose-1-phosphate uridylyltransferase
MLAAMSIKGIKQMPAQTTSFAPIAAKMRREGLSEVVIKNFAFYYDQVQSGKTGMIPEARIRPVAALPDADTFPDNAGLIAAGEAALAQTVVLKLNGGLGTSMGLSGAKSLLTVKEGYTFLDIISRQALEQDTPLVFMNSFSTHDDTLAALSVYPSLKRDIPLGFLQNKVPKITQSDLSAVDWPEDPALEWCPPGHGDIYVALKNSGMLETLLRAGYKYVFVSNTDNLGAVLDTSILGYFAVNDLPFMMEVADRNESDRKGGHLAEADDGQLILRESAQCPEKDRAAFEDIKRHKYFNTNNLWLKLPALQELMAAKDDVLGLPMILNHKTVDPRDGDSTPVYQLETAMGSAIAVFPGSAAVRVSRSRFVPIKTTDDLLSVRSDVYLLTDDHRVILEPSRAKPPFIQLDSNYFKLIDDLEARFPAGAPSLIKCESLKVSGDVTFGRDIVIEGVAELENSSAGPLSIADGSYIAGE